MAGLLTRRDCPELPNQDFEVAGIHFRNEAFGMFRARPLYLFVQAMPR